MAARINRREATALMNALSHGVVARIGLRHIMVDRRLEVAALLRDLSGVAGGAAAFRVISGDYGSGKSFLLQVIRNNAMERSFVVMDADLTPEHRLYGSKHQGLDTYRELVSNLSIQARPEGGALESVLQKWISQLQMEVMEETGLPSRDPELINAVSRKINEAMLALSEMPHGFSFATVLDAYWQGRKTGNDVLTQAAVRWLRGEYATKTEARRDLKVDKIIDDQSWYEFIKLLARFVTLAGYQGLLIFLDEADNLYKIANKQARNQNYEKLLAIFNDTMQGRAAGLGVFMSGTPQFITDERRGLYSYEALRSRLTENPYTSGKYVDMSGPVIRLQQLKPEEIYVLLEKLCAVHNAYYSAQLQVTGEEITAFMNLELKRLGSGEFLTPREVIRKFLALLSILQQNPGAQFMEVIKAQAESAPAAAPGSAKPAAPDGQGDEIDKIFAELDL